MSDKIIFEGTYFPSNDEFLVLYDLNGKPYFEELDDFIIIGDSNSFANYTPELSTTVQLAYGDSSQKEDNSLFLWHL